MTALIAVLWCLYLSECFVRWRPTAWVFRERAGSVEAVDVPDVSFANGRASLVWIGALPWQTGWACDGGRLTPQDAHVRVSHVRAAVRRLRVAATALFATVMVGFPILVVTELLVPLAPLLLLLFVVAWIATFALFVTAYRRVYGHAPPIEKSLVLALSPLTLARAPLAVTLASLDGLHPIAAGDALCGDDEFVRVARLWHFDRPELRAEIEDRLKRRGLDQALAAPPAETEAGVTLFCRRCHATFTGSATDCPDCNSGTLAPLDPAGRAPSSAHVRRT